MYLNNMGVGNAVINIVTVRIEVGKCTIVKFKYFTNSQTSFW